MEVVAVIKILVVTKASRVEAAAVMGITLIP